MQINFLFKMKKDKVFKNHCVVALSQELSSRTLSLSLSSLGAFPHDLGAGGNRLHLGWASGESRPMFRGDAFHASPGRSL